jgi:hypothetical protein
MKKPSKKIKLQIAPAEELPSFNGDLQLLIQRRAYELWEQSGHPHGRDVEHWLAAEKELSNGHPE